MLGFKHELLSCSGFCLVFNYRQQRKLGKYKKKKKEKMKKLKKLPRRVLLLLIYSNVVSLSSCLHTILIFPGLWGKEPCRLPTWGWSLISCLFPELCPSGNHCINQHPLKHGAALPRLGSTAAYGEHTYCKAVGQQAHLGKQWWVLGPRAFSTLCLWPRL